MAKHFGTTLASIALVGTALLSVTPAALADDSGTHAARKAKHIHTQPASDAKNEQYRAMYNTPASEQQTPAAPASTVEKDPPSFYHAMGTMGSP